MQFKKVENETKAKGRGRHKPSATQSSTMTIHPVPVMHLGSRQASRFLHPLVLPFLLPALSLNGSQPNANGHLKSPCSSCQKRTGRSGCYAYFCPRREVFVSSVIPDPIRGPIIKSSCNLHLLSRVLVNIHTFLRSDSGPAPTFFRFLFLSLFRKT
jgi:hypothetical protein